MLIRLTPNEPIASISCMESTNMTKQAVTERETTYGTTDTKRDMPRTEAIKLARATFNAAAKLLRAEASGNAGRAVARAAEALVRANALHENPMNNGPEQYDRWCVELTAARREIAYIRKARKER